MLPHCITRREFKFGDFFTGAAVRAGTRRQPAIAAKYTGTVCLARDDIQFSCRDEELCGSHDGVDIDLVLLFFWRSVRAARFSGESGPPRNLSFLIARLDKGGAINLRRETRRVFHFERQRGV